MTAPSQPAAAVRKPQRRWRQFSISSLLLLMLVCAVVLALIVNPAERQRRAVEYVESLKGGIAYAEENARMPAPKWLRRMLGKDYFQSVHAVTLSGRQVSDAGLAHLKGLKDLALLDLSNTRIGDAGLAHLKGLTQLRTLDLHYTRVSDAGLADLKALSALRHLRHLHLEGTHVSHLGLADLKQALPKCAIYW